MPTLFQMWGNLFAGAGHVPPPDPGNRNNAPASPPVQEGSYEFIIPQMFPNMDVCIIDNIPLAFQVWPHYAVNSYPISGLTGGGSTGNVPGITNGPIEYYDQATGTYVDLTAG